MNFAELPLVATPIALVDQNVVNEAIQKCMVDKNLDNPRLIRESMNAVYLVQSSDGPQIMRVSRPTSSTMAAIEFAHYLARHGFEVPAPLSQTPFRHDEIEITFWEFINHDPHHDIDSMEDVERYDSSDDLANMFDVSDGFAFRDEPSDTFQHDAGDINRMGDEGLGQDTENDMDLGKSKPGYDFYSGGSEGCESFPNTDEMEESEDWEELTEAKSERKQILEMIQRMKNFM